MIGVFEAIKIGTNFCDIQNDTPYFSRCVAIRDIIFLNDSKCFHLESCIALRQCWSLMNLWIMIELDTLYKSANETFSLFLKGDVKNSSHDRFRPCWRVSSGGIIQFIIILRAMTKTECSTPSWRTRREPVVAAVLIVAVMQY